MVLALVIIATAVGHSASPDQLRPHPESETPTDPDQLTDTEIRDLLVRESIARYTGPCACPYHHKWNEKLFRFPNRFRNHPTLRCGSDSEYLRPGGPTVFCFGSDVPQDQVEAYRAHLRSTFLTEPMPKF